MQWLRVSGTTSLNHIIAFIVINYKPFFRIIIIVMLKLMQPKCVSKYNVNRNDIDFFFQFDGLSTLACMNFVHMLFKCLTDCDCSVECTSHAAKRMSTLCTVTNYIRTKTRQQCHAIARVCDDKIWEIVSNKCIARTLEQIVLTTNGFCVLRWFSKLLIRMWSMIVWCIRRLTFVLLPPIDPGRIEPVS